MLEGRGRARELVTRVGVLPSEGEKDRITEDDVRTWWREHAHVPQSRYEEE